MKLLNLFNKIILKLFSYLIRLKVFLLSCPKTLLSPLLILFYKREGYKRSRNKPHFLILRNEYYSASSTQESTEVMHLDHTLESSKLGTFEVLTYDKDLSSFPLSDYLFIKKCQEKRFDAIVLSSWNLKHLNHPSLSALKFVRNKLQIPIVSIWWDTCSKEFGCFLNKVFKEFDVHVIIDNPSLHFIDRKNKYADRLLNLWPPEDENLYHPPLNGVRDIRTSFLGQVSSYRSYRSEVLEHLKEKGVPGYFRTSGRDSQVSHSEYADIMRRSKISINFSKSVHSHQLKSRVMEILFSGTLLMESDNEQTSKLFTPMEDYVPFFSKEDLLEKLDFYSRNDEFRKKISESGHAKAIKNYSSKIFWEKILERLNLTSDYNNSQPQ